MMGMADKLYKTTMLSAQSYKRTRKKYKQKNTRARHSARVDSYIIVFCLFLFDEVYAERTDNQ